MSDNQAVLAMGHPKIPAAVRIAIGQLFQRRRVVAHKLVLLIVLCSSFITLVATSLQLYLSYQGDVARLHSTLDQVERALVPSLTEAVWTFDGLQIQTQINGWLSLRDIESLKVTAGNLNWTAGKAASDNIIQHQVDITRIVSGKRQVIGSIEIIASLDKALQRVMDTALLILAGNAVKTLLVSTTVLIIYQVLVTQHIHRMSEYVKSFSPESGFDPLTLLRGSFNTDRADEIDDFAEEISRMCLRLHSEFSAAERAVNQFRDYADAAADWFWETDADGNVTFVSDRFRDMGGGDVDDVLGKNMDELRWLGARAVRGRVGDGDSGGPAAFHNVTDWRTFADGKRHCIQSSGIPVYGHGGKFAGYRCISIDVTDKMNARKQLVKRRRDFMETMHEMPYAVAWFDENDRLSYQNKVFEEMQDRLLGRDVQGLTFEEFLRAGIQAGLYDVPPDRQDEWISQRMATHHHPAVPDYLETLSDDAGGLKLQQFPTPHGGALLIIRSDSDVMARDVEQQPEVSTG